jgi:tetratricopeptide (TPR) repeat protein
MTTEADLNDGMEFLLATERLADNLEDDDAKAEVVSIIAARYAKLEQLDDAIELAQTIFDPFMRNNTFAEIAAASITTGASDYADALIEMIDDPGSRSVAIEEIAVQYAALGDLDKSLELASELDDPDPTLRRVALVDDTFSPRSVELALSITASDLRADTLTRLAGAALDADRKSEAAELLTESLRATEEIEFSQNRIQALVDIASLYEKIGDTDRALEILSRGLQLCQSFEGQPPPPGLSSSFPRGEALAQIAGSFARLGHFEQADLAAEQIEDPFLFAHASKQEAIEYFKAGQVGQAQTLLSEALELVLDEPAYGDQWMLMKDNLLAELAVSFMIIGHPEKSLQVTEKLSSEAQRYLALQEVGKECARAGNSHGIFQAAEPIANNYSKTSYWLAITDIVRESTETDLVRQPLFEAAQSAAVIQDNYERATSLIEIAYRFALINNSSKASELFMLALNTIKQLEQDDKKALSLLRIDEIFRELNRKPNAEEQQLLAQIGN